MNKNIKALAAKKAKRNLGDEDKRAVDKAQREKSLKRSEE